jgi:hypothetical protein
MPHACSSSGVSAWIVGRVVLMVRLVRVPVPGAGTGTTAMLHRRGPDHGDAPSWWLGPGRCRGCPGARGAGAAAGMRGPGRAAAGLAGPPRGPLAAAGPVGRRRGWCRPPGLSGAALTFPWCGSFGVRGAGRVAQAASRWPRGDLSCRTGPAGPLPSPGAAPPFRARWHPGYPRTWAVAHRARSAAPPRARGWQPRGRGLASGAPEAPRASPAPRQGAHSEGAAPMPQRAGYGAPGRGRRSGLPGLACRDWRAG